MKLYLRREFFTDKEALLLKEGELSVSAFRYASGVEALRVENSRGYFIILPFKGQQIWDLCFDGKELKMVTTVKEPKATDNFLETYGGFLYHCGINSMGAFDNVHPQHGELPNRAYDEAYIELGSDENGSYVAVGGSVFYRVAFTRAYRFSPCCKLYEKKAVLKLDTEIENLRTSPIDYMYLCHINFRPINGARLIDTAKTDDIKVHKLIPESLPEDAKKALSTYMDRVEKEPTLMYTVGESTQVYDPEICFTVQYEELPEKRGYTLQYLEGEGACYVEHPTDVLPLAIRWISRTPHEDAMGMALPATAEHLGYDYAKKHGQLKYIGGLETLSFSLSVGYLSESEAKEKIAKIESIRK